MMLARSSEEFQSENLEGRKILRSKTPKNTKNHLHLHKKPGLDVGQGEKEVSLFIYSFKDLTTYGRAPAAARGQLQRTQ